MFQGLKKLYENELYANVLPIGSILLTMYNNDRSSLTPESYFMSLMYYGISLYEERQYRRAEDIFMHALQAKKSVMKVKSSFGNGYDSGTDQFPESSIRLRLALCMEATREIPEAVSVLQAIPAKQRTVRINMLLAKLLQHNGYDKSAIAPLKDVLKECPLNLEAIKGLLELGVKQSEFATLMADAGVSSQCTEWLNNYITAHVHMYTSRFSEAIEAFQAIESKPGIGDNEGILVLIGQCYHYLGNHDTALYYLMRAYNNNNYMVEGLMSLASLYALKDRLDDLDKLTMPTIGPGEYTAEYWFVLAQHLFSQGKYDKAVCFAEKSCYMKPKNAEANLLKVKICMHLKKYKEAIVYLRMLQQFASHRFEVYEGLVEAYLATNRPLEAQEIAKIGVRRFGPNVTARSCVLLARPYFVHVSQRMKAKAILERALVKDEYYLPAVLLLVTLMQDANDTEGAVKLIKKQLAMQPNSKLYSLLGDIVCVEKDHAKAVEYYTSAITMDPTNRKAVAGLIGLGQSASKNDTTTAGPSTYTNATTATDLEEVLFGTVTTTEAPGNISDSWSDLEIDEQIVGT